MDKCVLGRVQLQGVKMSDGNERVKELSDFLTRSLSMIQKLQGERAKKEEIEFAVTNLHQYTSKWIQQNLDIWGGDQP